MELEEELGSVLLECVVGSQSQGQAFGVEWLVEELDPSSMGDARGWYDTELTATWLLRPVLAAASFAPPSRSELPLVTGSFGALVSK
jgi:hypothetical protein